MAEPAIRFNRLHVGKDKGAAYKMYGVGCGQIDSVELEDICAGKPLPVVSGKFPMKCAGLQAWCEDGRVGFCPFFLYEQM